jgi:hypothetical protein
VYWSVAILAGAITLIASGLTSLLRQGTLNLQVVSTFLVGESLILSIIAFLAAIIPIVFSVSTLAIQHAASNYTASVIEQYKRDRRTWFFYGFVGFGILLAASMLIAGSSVVIVASGTITTTISLLNSSFVILAFSLLLLPLQLLHVVDLIDPKFMIAQAKEEGLKAIQSAPAKLLAIIKKAQHGDEFEQSMAKMPFYSEFAFQKNQDKLLLIAREKVLQIMDIALKSALKREAETYSDAFQAICEIARAYVSIRKEYSRSEDEFLQYVYVKLVSMKKMGLDAEDEVLLTGIITTLGAIGSAAAEIKPASLHGPNLMASLAMLYISEMGAGAIAERLWDPAADALRSIRDVGISAVRVAKHDGSASDKILVLGKQAIAARKWFVVNVASGTLNELLLASVEARIDEHHTPANIMEAIEEFSLFAIRNGLDWNALSGLFPAMPEYSLERVVRAALQYKNEPHQAIETARREGYAHEIASSVLDLLIHIGIQAGVNKSSMVMSYVAQPIHRIALALMGEKSAAPKGAFEGEVCKAVGGLASIYQHAGDCPLLEVIPDSLTDIAFCSIGATKDEIALRVVEAIHQMSVETISWDKYGYDAHRLAGRLAVIGSYAVNARNRDVAEGCVKSLIQLDRSFIRKYGKQKEQLHLTEARELHDEDHLSLEDWQDKYRKMPQAALDEFIELYNNASNPPRTRQKSRP